MQEVFKAVFALDKIQQTASSFLTQLNGHKRFAFIGGMGAGKTTFIKTLCHQLGTVDLVTSPTFSIINEYTSNNGGLIYHFDFYRIEKSDELFGIGLEEYFESDAYCFIEWPEIAHAFLPDDTLEVRIAEQQDGSREIVVTK